MLGNSILRRRIICAGEWERCRENKGARHGRLAFGLNGFEARKISRFPVGRESLMGIDAYLEEPSRETSTAT